MKVIKMNSDGVHSLSAEQIYVGDILATPGRNGMTLQEIGNEVNVSPRTISRWRAQPEFARYVDTRMFQIVGERIPNIYAAVADRAEQGSAKHAELIFKSYGYLQDRHLITQQLSEDDPRSDERILEEIERLRIELGEDI